MKDYIVNLRVISSFAVVLLHVVASHVLNFNKIDLTDWKIANLLDSALRFCVPIFVMISGVLLLQKDESISSFLSKRLKRVVVPFLFWSVVYFVHQVWGSGLGLVEIGERFYFSFMKGMSYHFWYVYMIIGLYLFIPILRKWTASATKSDLQYFLLIWGVSLFLNEHTSTYFFNIELMYFSKFIGLLVLGFYLDKYVDLSSKYVRMICFSIYVLGVTITYYLTYLYSVRIHKFDPTFYNYLSPNVAIISAGLFLLMKSIHYIPNKFIRSIDQSSYGIYLVHILILDNLKSHIYQFHFDSSMLSMLTNVFTLSISTYLVSYLTILGLSNVKGLNNIVT